MQVSRVVLLVCAFSLLTGCGGGGGGGGSTTPIVPPAPKPTLSVSQASAPLTATLTESAATVAVSGSITYTLTVANSSASATTLVTTLDAGQAAPIASVSVKDPAGLTVYPEHVAGGRPLLDPPPVPGSDGTTLQPGQSVSFTRTVSEFRTAGTYSAVATFTLAASSLDAGRTVTLPALSVTAR